ncbi:hypothetical protein SAMN05878482_10317 [Peribacillus simplex]|uniref:Uncharacterized protein n=1 Tax=Peribacillus simplex TaxID=1478 RepID=A0A9X8R8Q3_9BACI|nr:hypothetical protein SAMN05878482_10317 [Peribacillus simplex]
MRLCLPYSSLLIYVSPIIFLKGNYGLLDSPYMETLCVPVRTKSMISSFDSLLRPRVSMVLPLCGVPPASC